MAINIIVSRRRYRRLNTRAKYCLKQLKRGKGNARKQLVIVATIIAVIVPLAFIIHGLIVDIPKGTLSASELVIQSVLTIVGALVGMGFLIFILWTLLKFIEKRRYSEVAAMYVFNAVFYVGLGLSVPAIISLRFISMPSAAFMVGFAFNSMLLGLLLGLFPLMIRLLALTDYRVVKIGLVVFVFSKFLQLYQHFL